LFDASCDNQEVQLLLSGPRTN